MHKVLITGFEPFDGDGKNPSLEIIRTLHGESIDRARVVTKELPCIFEDSLRVLLQEVEKTNPNLVICLGQSKGRTEIAVERVALNIVDAPIPDNKGKQPIDVPVIQEGPVALWSTLPIKAIVSTLHQNGIPATVSQTAGTYICNYVFYGLMYAFFKRKSRTRAGFIHVPALPEQVVGTPYPSMHLDVMVEAIRLIIQTTLTHKKDIQKAEGSLH